MSKKKKIIVLSCMIALLAITAIANVLFMGNNQNTIESQATSSTSNYFTQYRSERNVNRSEELLQLELLLYLTMLPHIVADGSQQPSQSFHGKSDDV